MVGEPTLFNNRILFTTLIPNSTVCGNGGTGRLLELDAVTGSALTEPTFDVNDDGVVDAADHLGTPGVYASGVAKDSIPSAVRVQKNPGKGTLLKPLSMSKNDESKGVAGALEIDLNSLGSMHKRSSWRQIFE